MTRHIARYASALFVGIVPMVGCGKVGPPVPPEYVGVGPLVERQRIKAEQAQKAKAQAPTFSAEEAGQDQAPTVEGVRLPPLHPGGMP